MKIDITPERSGVIFTADSLLYAVANAPNPLFCTLDTRQLDHNVSIEDVAGTVSELEVVDGRILATLKILETPKGNIIRQLISSGANFKYTPLAVALGNPCTKEIDKFDFLSINAKVALRE